MEWIDIGRDSLTAAKDAQKSHPRSCISRAYYAVHSILAESLIAAGYKPVRNRQTPPHEAQPKLIGQHFAKRGERLVRELRAIVRRLYAARLDADYNCGITIDERVSLQAIRDAYAVFYMLQVSP